MVPIRITRSALTFMRSFAQHDPEAFEAGGLLYARIEEGLAVIVEASGPRPTDERSRFNISLGDKDALQGEIYERFSRGLHYVGEWHTHAESHPKPSDLDIESIKDSFSQSEHSLHAVVLIIVGLDGEYAAMVNREVQQFQIAEVLIVDYPTRALKEDRDAV